MLWWNASGSSLSPSSLGYLIHILAKLDSTVEILKKESAAKDEKIATLQRQVTELEIKMDDHEQHGRRDSVRIFGLSEISSGTTDEKVLRLCNKRMKLSPPLSIEEISVSHQVGKPREPAEDGTPPLLVHCW